jgi:hypothetical protein
MVESNPLALGLMAMALGSVAALAVPETRRVQALMRDARDALIERAQTTALTTIEKVQQVTGEVGETVEKEAKYQGLTGKSK